MFTAAASCGARRFANGERAYGPGGAPGSLKIGFGRGRVGDGVAKGLGLLAAYATAAALGDGGRWSVLGDGDAGGRRLGNLIRSFRDSVVSLRVRTGSACVDTGSTLTTLEIFSSPSLSSSMISVGDGNRRTRCAWCGTGGSEGTSERRTAAAGGWVGIWACCETDVCADGGAGVCGGGVGVEKSGGREGAVSSKVR